MDELLTTKQVQAHLQVDRTTVYRMLKDGRLQGVKVGQQWRFPLAAVEALLTGAPPPSREIPKLSSDILPVHCLQAVQDVSAETVDVGAIITDNHGLPITEISNCSRFCEMILGTESGRQACITSWRKLARRRETHPRFVTCHAGFQYARARIEVDGEPAAMFVAGQFFTSPPDPVDRRKQVKELAQLHGLDPVTLSEADLPPRVLSKAKQGKITVWLEKLANTFTIISLERAEMLDRLQRIAKISAIASE